MDEEADSAMRNKRPATKVAGQIAREVKSEPLAKHVKQVVAPRHVDPAGPDDSNQRPLFSRSAAAARILGDALFKDVKVASHRAKQRLRVDVARLSSSTKGLSARVRKADYFRPRPRMNAVTERVSGWMSRFKVGRSGNAGNHAELRPAQSSQFSGRLKRWIAATVAIFVGGTMIAAVTTWWALRDVPWQEIAEGSLKPVVVLESADGQPLVQQGPFQGAYATRDYFPQHLVDAVLSVEDRRFYEHSGIDLRGIARALFRNLSAGEVVEGGSTITQQLIKILYLENERSYKRKIQEFFIALWLENKFGKDEILTRYLNNIYLGAGATGIPAAARVYFDKDPRELNLRESAMLAGIIQAPSQLSPVSNPAGARARQAIVLDTMVANGKLSAAEAADAKTELEIRPTRPAERAGSWFADWVMADARAIAGPYRGTIRVRTTLIPKLQVIAEQVVAKAMSAEGDAMGASQAALVAMTPEGAVVAMVGGRDYGDSEFNRAATAERQPGSTFKLFVLYAALKAGKTPRDLVMDEKIDIDGWSPENFNGEYNGKVTIAEAFARSLNAATVALAQEVGIDRVAAAARELGIDAHLSETPALALGASEVTLVDLTGAYASVRAGVAPVEPWGIFSFRGDQQRDFRVGPSRQPEISLKAMQNDLVGLLHLVVERGTGREARFGGGFSAGKTGTSQNYRDAWFVGFTEPLVAGVWVGNDDGSPMRDVTGGKLPAVIWKNFMMAAMAELSATPPTAEQNDAPATASAKDESVSCNVRACSRSYRSFRPSDCTYQPYRGTRRLCEK